MKIAIVGTGYVGLVTGTCFAEIGIDVTCVDIDKNKIEKLNQGVIPIYEPGLDDMVLRNVQKGRLHFTTSLIDALKDTQVIFSAVGTPPGEDGSADLKYVLAVAKEIGQNINDYVLVVTKSTVPPGTATKVKQTIQQQLDARKVSVTFDVASNPEFLKEGDAINDFIKPDRIIVGVDSAKAEEIMRKLFKPFTLNGHPILFMDVTSAEMTKYAANAMLATKISFINDIANFCELIGADINMVRKGIGSDSRIGNKFIYPGVGYGGSCFPKDVQALVRSADEHNYKLRVLQAVEDVNNDQKLVLYNKASKYFNEDLKGKKVAMWGLAFKPQTDDMREAPSLVIIEELLKAGATVVAYDPVAIKETQKRLGDRIGYTESPYDALQDADCLMLVTEWKEFRFPDFKKVKALMKQSVVFDGRNIYDKQEMLELGFEYFSIG